MVSPFPNMHANARSLLIGMRWALLLVLLLFAGVAYYFSEGSFDRLTRPFCPDGWWRTGAFWAHCSYPPMSISKYGVMYGSLAALALFLVHFAAPSHQRACSRGIMLLLMVPPAFHLLVAQFSWVEIARLIAVLAVELIFEASLRFWRRGK